MNILKKKKWKRLLPWLVAAAVLAIALLGWYLYTHTFSAGKWRDRPELRMSMVENLQDKHLKTGVSQETVLELLGQPDNDKLPTIKGETLAYYLDRAEEDSDLDTGWLIINFHEGKLASRVVIPDQSPEDLSVKD